MSQILKLAITKIIIAALALLVAPQIALVHAVTVSFPNDLTIATVTPQQLAYAVGTILQANPANTQGIAVAVVIAIAGLPNALATALASNTPPLQAAAIIAAAGAAAAGSRGLTATTGAAATLLVPAQSACSSCRGSQHCQCGLCEFSDPFNRPIPGLCPPIADN